MKVRTWNNLEYDQSEIESRSNEGDLYFVMLREWSAAMGIGWPHLKAGSRDGLSSLFSNRDVGLESRYLYSLLLIDEANDPVMEDYRRVGSAVMAARMLVDLTEEGFSPAAYQLGLIYRFGLSGEIQPNKELSTQWMVSASNMGHLLAKKWLLNRRLERFGLSSRIIRNILILPLAIYGIFLVIKDPGAHRANH